MRVLDDTIVLALTLDDLVQFPVGLRRRKQPCSADKFDLRIGMTMERV